MRPNDINSSEWIFFDISQWIQNLIKKPIEFSEKQANLLNKKLQTVIDAIIYLVDNLGNNSIIGGAFEFVNQIGYCFFLSQEENHDLIDQFKNLVSNIGAYPEMLTTKSALVDIDFQLDLPGVGDSPPLDLPMQAHPFEDNFKECLNILDKLMADAQFSTFFGITKVFLDILYKPEENIHNVFQDARFAINNSIEIILKNLQLLSEGEIPFCEKMNAIHRIFEELVFHNIFINPQSNTLNAITNFISPLYPRPVTPFLFDSGMATLDYLIESTRTAILENTSQTGNLSLLVTKGVYYEINELADFLEVSGWEISTIEDFTINTRPDLLILDLFPNDATQINAMEIPATKLINQGLEFASVEQPLTVIIDTSTTLLTNVKVHDIAESFTEPLDQGLLNIIFFTSLAKFYNIGLDKFTGGLALCLGEPQDFQVKAGIWAELARNQNTKDPISSFAQGFFSILLENALGEIENFYKQVLENSNSLYDKLKEGLAFVPPELSSENPGLFLQQKAENIPMIGLRLIESQNHEYSSEEFETLTTNLQYYLYSKARENNLNLFIRASFPFIHSSFVECTTALRLTPGIDQNQEHYAALIFQMNEELKQLNFEGRELRENEETANLCRHPGSLESFLFADTN